jgi:hypothetical protein
VSSRLFDDSSRTDRIYNSWLFGARWWGPAGRYSPRRGKRIDPLAFRRGALAGPRKLLGDIELSTSRSTDRMAPNKQLRLVASLCSRALPLPFAPLSLARSLLWKCADDAPYEFCFTEKRCRNLIFFKVEALSTKLLLPPPSPASPSPSPSPSHHSAPPRSFFQSPTTLTRVDPNAARLCWEQEARDCSTSLIPDRQSILFRFWHLKLLSQPNTTAARATTLRRLLLLLLQSSA